MAFANPERVPLDDVLDVIIENLPLKEDYDENEPLFRLILKLCRSPLDFGKCRVRARQNC
jgi:hypothetical protein